MDAAEEEGIIEPEQAHLIEQVVEFSDKRVRELMTPRPDVVAMQADATLERCMRGSWRRNSRRCRCTKIPWTTLKVWLHAQDLLQIADTDLPKRKVRELMRAGSICAGDQSWDRNC